MNLENRIRLTSSCKDCEHLERHPKAGKLETDEQGRLYQYMFNGIKILYGTYHSPWMNEIVENLNGHHEPQEELSFHFVLKTLGDSANMIELGANWAYYSIWFNKLVKNPFNLCIEPIASNMMNGQKNIELNECKNIEYVQGYLGETYSDKEIFKNWDDSLIELRRFSLEKLVNDHNKYFDIIHADIQGDELIVLQASESILPRVGYFIISTHNDKHEKCLKLLNDYDFTILIEHTIEQSFSADGLIVAINNKNKNKYEFNIGSDLNNYFKQNCKITKA
jgi:FkbM family methyltransferase